VRTDAVLEPAAAIAGTADGAGYWVALSPADRRPLGQFVATCYTGGVSTATGAVPSSNVIAVDPGVIPLGSQVFIPGIGVRVAADTGGGIRGARVDVWEPSLQQCVQFGVQPVAVYLVG
jgi:3D (Asp-Asp-Asp) domain-containing protein